MGDTAENLPSPPQTDSATPVDDSGAMPPKAEQDVSCLADVLPKAVGGTADTEMADAAKQRRQEVMANTWETIKAASWRIFVVLQDVGEVVASVLGLNESKFQYVINNMTEEDWRVAREVQRRREAELANKPIADMEGGEAEVEAVKDATKVER